MVWLTSFFPIKEILHHRRIKTRSSVTPSPAKTAPSHQTNDALVRSGLLFLLKQKDRCGVWYSTQATINVLDAMLALLSHSPSLKNSSGTQSSAAIVANGRAVQTVEMPLAHLTNPITVDLSRFLQAGNNQIEIRRAGGSALDPRKWSRITICRGRIRRPLLTRNCGLVKQAD